MSNTPAKSTEPARKMLFWGVYNQSLKRVAKYDFTQKKAALIVKKGFKLPEDDGSKVIPYSNPYVITIVQKYDMTYGYEYGIIGNDAKATNRQPGTTPLGWAESGRHQTTPLRRGGQASRRPPTCPLGVRAVGRRASATHWGSTE